MNDYIFTIYRLNLFNDKAVSKAKQPFGKSLSILEAPLQCV